MAKNDEGRKKKSPEDMIDISSFDKDSAFIQNDKINPKLLAALAKLTGINDINFLQQALANNSDLIEESLLASAPMALADKDPTSAIKKKLSVNPAGTLSIIRNNAEYPNKIQENIKLYSEPSIEDKIQIANLVELCATGDVKAVKKLIQENNILDLNFPSKLSKQTPLVSAVANNHSQLVKALLEIPNVDVNATSNLGAWSRKSDTDLNEILPREKHLEDFVAKASIDKIDVSDYFASALHVAARKDDSNILKMLIESGAKLNKQSLNNCTPLHTASSVNTNALIAAGADINPQNSFGDTPLHFATGTRDYQRTLSLLKAGADINIYNNDGKSVKAFLSDEPHIMMEDDLPEGRESITELIKASEYGDKLKAFLQGHARDFKRDEAIETKHKELIAERISNRWNGDDLNYLVPTEAQNNLWKQLTSLEMDKDLAEQILHGYTEKLNNFTIQKQQDNEATMNILRQIVPFATHKVFGASKDSEVLPCPDSPILALSVTPEYLKQAGKLIEENARNPEILLHQIVTGNATIDGKKLPSFEESLAENNMSLDTFVVVASQIPHLRHKNMTSEMKESVDSLENNICLIKLSNEQAKEAIVALNPHLSEINSAAAGGAGASSRAESEKSDVDLYHEAVRFVTQKYRDAPAVLLEMMIKGEGLPKILTMEPPEAMPEPYVPPRNPIDTAEINEMVARIRKAASPTKDEPANGGAGVGRIDEEYDAPKASATGSAHTAFAEEESYHDAIGGAIHSGEDTVGSKSVRSTSSTPAHKAAAAAKARNALEHAKHTTGEVPLSPTAGGAKGRDSSLKR